MDATRRRFVDDLYVRSREHDAALADRLERFRNVEPPTAELLGVLIRATGARRILELGTSNGYSTIWLADAAESTGGSVVTVDVDPSRSELARENLRVAGLEPHVELRIEDAAETLARSDDGEWEFVFLDSERPAYPSYLRDLVRTLAPRGLLAIDNVDSHAHELVNFTSLIEAEPALTQTVVPVGAGLRLAVLADPGYGGSPGDDRRAVTAGPRPARGGRTWRAHGRRCSQRGRCSARAARRCSCTPRRTKRGRNAARSRWDLLDQWGRVSASVSPRRQHRLSTPMR